MISVIIPAHNEAQVLGRTLAALVGEESAERDLEVIVVANGCTDATANVARALGERVRVVETTVASKTGALNLGDALASGFPRVYLDADIVISAASVRALCKILDTPRALAAAPRAELRFPRGSSWAVRRYYDFWGSLPYVREGMVTAGVYAVNLPGRRRFGEFPDLICDDTYFRFHFSADERVQVDAAVSTVTLPGKIFDLIKLRTRTRLGLTQLRLAYPHLLSDEIRPRRYLSALPAILARPSLYFGGAVYLLVHAVSAWRAKRQAGHISSYRWERDASSRNERPDAPATGRLDDAD